ncbi:MAG: 50S ribosomal protein L10 [Thiotrichales bacterium]|nr:50S ribosomal protein L10 [Thiotrichales bacterium]
MSLTLEQKKVIVEEVAEIAAKAPTAIAAEYSGLTVAEMTELRKTAREAGIYLKVVRNTLARMALADTQFECMRESLTGPLLLAFSNEEPGSAAKVIRDFSKDNEKLVVKLVSIDGQLLNAGDIDRLASMPSLDEARAMLLGLLQAPMSKFVRTVAEPQAKFARLLAAKRDQAA